MYKTSHYKIDIGNKVKFYRLKNNFNLMTLSKMSGVQLATLSRIENNKMVGTLESHLRIATALQIELMDLYKNILITNHSSCIYSGLG